MRVAPFGLTSYPKRMNDDDIEEARTFIGWICSNAEGGTRLRLHEIMLSTGTVLEGQLSPFDKGSDFIRFNATDARYSYAIPLQHIVYVREIDEPKPKAGV